MIEKTICFFVSFLFLNSSIFSQNTFVPDDNFEQALIDLGLDSGPLDNFVLTSNIANITNLDIPNKNITDITGIEAFTALETFDCSENNITILDVSNNLNLTQLFCNDNALTTLNISQNTQLNILWCDNNQLSTLNVDNNPNLLSLTCTENLINSLNLLNNAALNTFICSNNQLSNLDVSQNPQLRIFRCNANQITAIDVSKNLNLTEFNCSNNQISEIDVNSNFSLQSLLCSTNMLRTLDLSANTNLDKLLCDNNNLCQLNLRNGNNTKITDLNTKGNADLYCIRVDDVNFSQSNWNNSTDSFTNFVNSIQACNTINPLTPPVDILNDFFGTSYTLPTVINGNYYTESNGSGTQLNSGDIITTSKTLYIYAENECAYNESNFSIVISDKPYFIPKFFTPNNDATNDEWRVLDTTHVIKSITIYNHYGKLIKYLKPNVTAWDGTFNGKPLATNDFWYVIEFKNGKIERGHFTLKR